MSGRPFVADLRLAVTASLRPLLRSPRVLWTIVPWLLFAAVAAKGGATAALLVLGRVAAPIVTFAALRALTADAPIPAVAGRLALVGLSPRAALAGLLLSAAALSALPLALAGAAFAASAHGPHDLPVVQDALRAALYLLGTSLAYLALFAAVSLRAPRLGGALLFVDLFFAGSGPLSVMSPRAHGASLLGGPDVVHLPPLASSGALFALTVAFALPLALRLRREATR